MEQIDEIFGGNVPLGIGNHGAAAHAGQGHVKPGKAQLHGFHAVGKTKSLSVVDVQ